ncbi:MAG: HPr family phosphocarrier protein [Deltaproteobacteria bacterium]|nr:MAG: HPr family phosphocarrier protein [Deltaproteobacteria bacterium]
MEKAREQVVTRDFEITNELGLHARAASALANLAGKFSSEIKLVKDGVEVNGKSIMGILMLAAPKGSVITVEARGEDALEAVDAIGELIKDRFGEEK